MVCWKLLHGLTVDHDSSGSSISPTLLLWMQDPAATEVVGSLESVKLAHCVKMYNLGAMTVAGRFVTG